MNKNTLLIRHLPRNLSDEQKTHILKHFNAVEIKCVSGREKKSNVVFARFESEGAANLALHRLHQLDVMGYPLTVECARNKDTILHTPSKDKLLQVNIEDEKENSKKYYEVFIQKLNSWNAPLNFCQPPPPHLSYLYPPPSHTVLSNISVALASVPKFYTQVLHLMNKMNLPSPFEKSYQPKVVASEIPHIHMSVKNTEEAHLEVAEDVTSEEESEMESEPESHKYVDIIPTKRSKPQVKRMVKKKKFVKPEVYLPSTKTVTKPEEVFEMAGSETVQRKVIELKISGETVEQPDSNKNVKESGGFGLMFPTHQLSTQENQDKDDSENNSEDFATCSTITAEQLAANRIPSRDQRHLPVFKNYQPGIPSCRLYIKNLSKQVDERDLHFIYRRYLIADCEEQGNMFDIRLMKEGRMKGQAFVTLQNTKQAQRALIETNGFILKDKPLVVQFARSAKAK